MNDELKTRLEEAFSAQATTTTTSDDAWARIHRRAEQRDHRRSVVLRSVAAAVITVLLVGGGVALFRDVDEPGTVATGRGADASKSAAADSVESSGIGAVPDAPFVPAGNGLEVQQRADGTIVARFGSTTTPPVQPGGMSAAIDGDTVFGIVPGTATNVLFGLVPATPGGAVRSLGLGGSPTVTPDGLTGVRLFVARRGVAELFPETADAVSVAAYTATGGGLGETIARGN